MVDIKISALTAVVTPQDTDEFETNQGGTSKKETRAQIVSTVAGDLTTHEALTGANAHGLGTISTQAANNVAITGGSVTGITDITVADGGTGASTAATARTNLGAAASGLATGSGLTMATDRMLGRTTAATGAIEEISVGTGLTLSGGSLTTDSSLSTHAALTAAHGATGAVVGTTNAQTLSNKTLAATTLSGQLSCADQTVERPVIKDYGETVNAIGSIGGGTQDIDLTLGNVVTGTVDTSTTTFTFSNPPTTGTAGSFTLILTNGGSQTVNWPASVDWPAGTAPALTAAGVDILTFITLDAGTTWRGFASGMDSK